MVRHCCVVNCNSRSHDVKGNLLKNGICFYRIPAVNQRCGQQMLELTAKRRRAWVSAIRRTKVTFENCPPAMLVCSLHFHEGKPAYEMYEAHPDWVPSINMGHMEMQQTDVERFQRKQAREQQRQEAAIQRKRKAEEDAAKKDEVKNREKKEEERQAAEHVAETAVEAVESPEHRCKNCCEILQEMDKIFEENRKLKEVTKECNFCKKRQAEINRLLEENRSLKEELEKRRFNEGFLDDDTKVKYYTGLPSLGTFLVLLNHLLPFFSKHKRRVLTPFQMTLITFMRLRLNLPRHHIANLFFVSPNTVTNVFKETIDALYAQIGGLVFWPDRESLHASMPHQFLEAFGKKVAVIIDCFEIFTEKPSNLEARAQTFSSYKHHHTQKYLIGISPQGAISFISKGWGGRTSDKHITENCGFLNNLLPGDIVLADRGFDIDESVGLMCAEIKIPTFTKGRAQLDAKDVEETRNLAHLRIHVERVIGNLCNKYEILSSTVPISLLLPCEKENLMVLDKIVKVCCALTNMCPSVVS